MNTSGLKKLAYVGHHIPSVEKRRLLYKPTLWESHGPSQEGKKVKVNEKEMLLVPNYLTKRKLSVCSLKVCLVLSMPNNEATSPNNMSSWTFQIPLRITFKKTKVKYENKPTLHGEKKISSVFF